MVLGQDHGSASGCLWPLFSKGQPFQLLRSCDPLVHQPQKIVPQRPHSQDIFCIAGDLLLPAASGDHCADGLIHHSDHGTQCIGTVYATGVMEYGMLPSTGTVGDSYDNAMAESADGAYRTELVWRRRPFADLKDLELATFRWVSWWDSKHMHQSLGYRTPAAAESEYHLHLAALTASL